MMKTRNLILIGAAVFIVSLLLTAPIALLHAKFAGTNNTSGVQPIGLDGTLSDGHASSVLLNGQPLVTKLHWHFNPLSLLLARAAFHIDSSGDLTLEGKAAKLITGGLNLDDIRAAGPMRSLLNITGDVAVPIDGQFGLKLDSARIRSGFISSANGEVTINGLRWTLARDPVLLGDFILRVTTEKSVITAKLDPLSGPLDTNGTIIVMPDHSFEINVLVKPKPTADALVKNLVSSLGQPDTQGYFHIRNTGSLGGGAPPAAPGAPPPGVNSVSPQ